VDADAECTVHGVHVDVDPRGLGVLGGVRQHLRDDVVGRGFDRFGHPASYPQVERYGNG